MAPKRLENYVQNRNRGFTSLGSTRKFDTRDMIKTLPPIRSNRARGRSGQALLEYFIVFAMTLGVLVMLALFLGVFKEWGNRVLQLVASEFP